MKTGEEGLKGRKFGTAGLIKPGIQDMNLSIII
jgi:hypothetical protein